MIRLDLTQRGLEAVPDEVFAHADTLEELDLSRNRLTSLPDRMVELRRLKRLFCSQNPFEVFPEVLSQLPMLEMIGFKSCELTTVTSLPPRLRWLILTDNRISALPSSIGACSRLQKVALAGNQLSALPTTFANLSSLELLRISANRFSEFPTELMALPKLSWLAFAGNPFVVRPEVSVPSISWRDLSLHEVLGQGASGVISRATRRDTGEVVAVKVFKGAVTSDGLPEDEVTTCLVAGSHRNLVGVEGRVTDHPDGADALVLTLMPSRFHSLGAPPSFESCTRDVMSLKLNDAQSLRIARHVAEVGAHLHERGVLHGDLYAHNTRVDADGAVLVGDFGAASLMNGLKLEHLDVRAFGAMVDDLLSCGASPSLVEVRDACWSKAPPRFSELVK